jgi:hypothetical protein
MRKCDCKRGLQDLFESLNRIRALRAWEDLKRSERRPGDPPTLSSDSSLLVDLRNEYGFFIKTAMDIRQVLAGSPSRNSPEDKRRLWRQQLLSIETEVRQMNLPMLL